MDYNMEDLLPILVKLTEKYTSNESSSVSYETATMLMEAILYCINECCNDKKNNLFLEKSGAEIIYKRGYDLVIEKVCQSKEIYEQIINDFEDYGCNNYKSTIIDGMSAFFLRYDPRFQPQNHLLTLDYPSLRDYKELEGVDRIKEYLSDIRTEQKFLSNFGWEVIQKLLARVMPDYKEDYFENICYPVLLTGIGCIISDKPVYLLQLEKEDIGSIEEYFNGDNLETMEYKVRSIIYYILSKTSDKTGGDYFVMLSSDYAARMKHSLEYQSLENLFYVTL